MGQDALVGVPLTVTDLEDVDGISISYTDTIRYSRHFWLIFWLVVCSRLLTFAHLLLVTGR